MSPTNPQTTEERRLFERFTARFPVKFKDTREDYGTQVFLRDASAQGVRIVTKERFFLDDHIALQVELPDGKEPMALNGHVGVGKIFKIIIMGHWYSISTSGFSQNATSF